MPNTSCIALDEENEGQFTPPWTAFQAASQSQAYCVEVKPHLFPVDFDQSDGTEYALGFQDGLRAIGCLAVLLESGQVGHVHAWVSVDESRYSAVRSLATKFGGTPRHGQRMRPPFAPHRFKGLRMRLLYPKSIDEALELLKPIGPPPKPRARFEFGDETFCPSVVRYTGRRQAMLDMAGENRSDHNYGIACYYVRAGLGLGEFGSDVLGNPHGAGQKLAGRSQQDASSYLVRTYENASEAQACIAERLCLLRTACSLFAWPKRGGLSTTMLWVLDLAAVTGRTGNLAISCRDLAEMAGVNVTTASRHLASLQRLGWLSLLTESTGPEAATFEICSADSSYLKCNTQHAPPPEGRVLHFEHANDALVRKPTLRRTLMFIASQDRPVNLDEIAEATSRRRRACRTSISELLTLGLIQPAHDGWKLAESADRFKEAARCRGTYGFSKMQRAIHLREREVWQLNHSMDEGIDLLEPQ